MRLEWREMEEATRIERLRQIEWALLSIPRSRHVRAMEGFRAGEECDLTLVLGSLWLLWWAGQELWGKPGGASGVGGKSWILVVF